MVIIDNFTKVSNDVFLIMYHLKGAEVKIFFWIYRQTVGYNKKTDGISISQFSDNLKMSKMQVTRVIKSLKEKKLIIVKAQKNKNGAKYLNTYEINFKAVNNLVTKCDKGSNKMLQGVVTKCDKGSNKMLHTKDNNTKYNNTKEERENNTLQKNVFFSLSPNRQEYFLNEYLNHLVESSEYIKSETAFKIKIRKLFANESVEQLEEFERWYLENECSRLDRIYKGGEVIVNNSFTYIESIYPYFNTKGYNKLDKLYVWFKAKEDDTSITKSFINADIAEEYLTDNCEILENNADVVVNNVAGGFTGAIVDTDDDVIKF